MCWPRPLIPCSKKINKFNFVGNVEGRDVFLDNADVMVCEGFTGNVILKLAESLHGIMERQNVHTEYFDRFNFEVYGGTPVLGVNKPVIIGHGISRGKAYKNMLVLAQKMISTRSAGKDGFCFSGLIPRLNFALSFSQCGLERAGWNCN